MTLPTNDLRLAVRGLLRSPLFASVAILSLALGIGANTAIFTLIDQILLRKLPVKNPDELVMLHQEGPTTAATWASGCTRIPMYQEFQKRAEPFSEVIARRLIATSVSVDNQTERLDAEMVSGNYFTMLGVTPAVGRVFTSEQDDQFYEGHPVVGPGLRLLGPPFRPRPRCRWQEDPGQQPSDGHRRRVSRRICRARSDPCAADPRAAADEAGDGSGVGLAARR